MPAVRFDLRVEMEDGTTYRVVADQRDGAKWEIQPFGTSARELSSRIWTAMRFMAWSALTRRGEIKTPWERFDADCVEVSDVQEEPDAADDALDPGRPAPSDAS